MPRAGRGAAGDRGGGGERRLLPPDSPDLNPIEGALGKPKARLRAAAKRTARAAEGYPGELSTTFAPDEGRDDFRRRGYAATPK